MVVIQINMDSDGNLVALTDDGNIFVRINERWQYMPGPSADDLPRVDASLSIMDD